MRIAEVMQPHRLHQRSAVARHRAHMDFVRLPSLGVGAISFGEMLLELEEVEDYYLMIFCRRGSAHFRSGRRDLCANGPVGVCFAPGERVWGEFSNDCEQIVFRIEATAMKRYVGSRAPRLNDQIDLRRHAMRPWTNLANGIFCDPQMVDLLRCNDRVAADSEALLLSLWLSGDILAEEPQVHAIAPMTVKRAESFIDAHYSEPLTLQEIADSAGVPVRTLLDGFRRFRGISPMSYLRNRRLDVARRALLAADENGSVSAIALVAGFTHHGRFASDYVKRFGERPSDSLRRRG